MPYFLCKKCNHEFESVTKRKCDWCGNDDIIVLEEETPLEKMLKNSGTLLERLRRYGNIC